MSIREDQARILREMECDLRRGDRLLPVRFAFLRTRAALHRRTGRVLLAVEAALLALVLLGAALRLPWLLIPAAGAALTVPLLAVPWTTRPPGSETQAHGSSRNPRLS
ncbi:MAG TPA: hypothetical protein VFU73_09880 [Actinocrinis sp.]|nr:hypothetical protein [Actinocrinis sp.]